MVELSDEHKNLLREFITTPYWAAYKEYTILESGKCLGALRTQGTTHEQDIFVKGMMAGIERFFLDILSDMVDIGNVEKANHENMEYTKKLLEKNMG